jgi:iron complex transport system substrate-binding protein
MAAVSARLMRNQTGALVALAIACGVGLQLWPEASAAGDGPRRIVSLVPAATEMLYAMGEGGRVVGVGSYDRYPPEVERLPRVGGLLDPDVERLLALKPDLVIAYSTQTTLRHQLDDARIPLFVYVHRDLTDVTETIRGLGDRIGAGPAGRSVASGINARLAAIRARVAGRPRPRTLVVLGREPGALRNIQASGGYGFLHDMLDTAGGDDLLGDVRRESVLLSAEIILARAPEVIIELHYGASLAPNQLDVERRTWDALSSVPAVRNRRVYLLVGDEFVIPGPRVAAATERLSRTLHPESWALKILGRLTPTLATTDNSYIPLP